MEGVEKLNVLDRNKLNEEFYFKSLIEEAYRHRLLSNEEIEKIQFECIELLAYKIESYNSGYSSSIRVEEAENIMNSNLYTIGIWLKSFPSAEDAVKALKETKILTLYNYGRKRIETKLKAAKHIYRMVIQNIVHTENYIYHSTVKEGIKGFFKIYNSDYEAHDIRITADYPICANLLNLAGVEFIEKYLESVYYENMFCNYFAPEDIHHLLCGFDKEYRELIINIFEHVLTCAIGCKLAGIDAKGLKLTAGHIEFLKISLFKKSNDYIEKIIYEAVMEIQEELEISRTSLKMYIKRCLPYIISNICGMIKENKLDKVFIAPIYPKSNSKLDFSFGVKMDDKQYRKIVEEIMECRFSSDKIFIIKNKIHSLADLDDLFFDAELSACEITAILNDLELIEIAALTKRHPFNPVVKSVDLSEEEIEFSILLNNYIITQLPARKNSIIKTIDMLDIK